MLAPRQVSRHYYSPEGFQNTDWFSIEMGTCGKQKSSYNKYLTHLMPEPEAASFLKNEDDLLLGHVVDGVAGAHEGNHSQVVACLEGEEGEHL